MLAACGAADAAVWHVSPAGSDSAPCTPAAPCASFDRAYRAAAPGDTVTVAAGEYGGQTVDDDPSKHGDGRPAVLIHPALGARVVIADLLSYASNVHYSGFHFPLDGSGGQPDVRAGRNVIVQDMRATNLYVSGPTASNATDAPATANVTIKGGDYGPWPSCGGGSQIARMPTNVVVDRAYFHDYTVPSRCPSAHLDCLHTFEVVGMTIRNSRFVRCEHYGVLMNSNGPGRRDGHLVENNFFGEAGIIGFALRGGTDEYFDGVTVRYNSGGSITPQTVQAELKDVRWYANAAQDIGACRPGVAYAYNVVGDRGTCGSTDVAADPGFRDARNNDFRLVPGAAAIDRGGPEYPATDLEGTRRPTGARADAGADELGPPSTDAPTTGPPPTKARTARDWLRLASTRRRLRLARGVVRIRLRCRASAPGGRCAGRVSLRKKGRVLGRKSFRIRAGHSARVRVRLSRAARRAIARRGRLRATLRIRLKGGVVAQRRVVVRR